MAEFKAPADRGYSDKTLPQAPIETPSTYKEADGEFGRRSSLGYYDEGSLQPLGSYESRYGDPYGTPASQPYSKPRVVSQSLADPSHERNRSSVHTVPTFVAPEIPVGYAQAQLLPSRTVRLTIRLPRPFKWSPGQSCLLYLPGLSKFQSHPFTIVNNNEPEVVILVKARKGLTRQLFNHVRDRSLAAVGSQQDRDKRHSLASTQVGGQEGMQVPPVNLRAWLDGPFGSANRVRWNEYSTIVIVCGGSGVSFGAAVCDYACQMMAKNRDIGSSKVKTQRVRFCWVVREYAEIAWVAGQLYRCQQMVPPTQLEISIFVTKASKGRDEFSLPQPGFAKGGGRRDSMESVGSEMSGNSPLDLDEPGDSPADTSTQYADIIDLTNYDDEEDINDPAEQHLSDRLQHQGKVRRAKSRKAAKAHGQGLGHGRPQARNSNVYPPARRGPSMLGLDDAAGGNTPRRGPSMLALDSAADAYAAAADGHYESHLQPQSGHPRSPFGSRQNLRAASEEPFLPPPPLSAFDTRRQSYRSIADSTYGMYDPYAGSAGFRGPSPSPSILFDNDTHSIAGESVKGLLSRASRTGSMVFLEDAGSGSGATGPGGAEMGGADTGLWVDQADFAAMNVMSEMARPGKPKLSAVLEEEIHQAGGAMIVASEY